MQIFLQGIGYIYAVQFFFPFIQKSGYAKIPEKIGQQRLTFLRDLAAQQGRKPFPDPEKFKTPDEFTKWETEYMQKLEEQEGKPFKWRNYTHGIGQVKPKEDDSEEWNINDGE